MTFTNATERSECTIMHARPPPRGVRSLLLVFTAVVALVIVSLLLEAAMRREFFQGVESAQRMWLFATDDIASGAHGGHWYVPGYYRVPYDWPPLAVAEKFVKWVLVRRAYLPAYLLTYLAAHMHT
eukprot:6180483-Pleurochrysis_carterae.AAC.1